MTRERAVLWKVRAGTMEESECLAQCDLLEYQLDDAECIESWSGGDLLSADVYVLLSTNQSPSCDQMVQYQSLRGLGRVVIERHQSLPDLIGQSIHFGHGPAFLLCGYRSGVPTLFDAIAKAEGIDVLMNVLIGTEENVGVCVSDSLFTVLPLDDGDKTLRLVRLRRIDD